MRKLLNLLVATLLASLQVGCGQQSSNNQTVVPPTTTSTWTINQIKYWDVTLKDGTGGGTCGNTIASCTVNVTAIPAGDTLIAAAGSGSIVTLTAVSGGEAWVHCPNCLQQSANGAIDAAYVLRAIGGETSFTCTVSAVDDGQCLIIDLKWSGSNVSLDTSGSLQPAACTSCVGPSLALNNSNDAIATLYEGANQTVTAVSSPYSANTVFYPTFSAGIAAYLNASSGAAPTWTTRSDTPEIMALAFSGTSSGVQPTPVGWALTSSTSSLTVPSTVAGHHGFLMTFQSNTTTIPTIGSQNFTLVACTTAPLAARSDYLCLWDVPSLTGSQTAISDSAVGSYPTGMTYQEYTNPGSIMSPIITSGQCTGSTSSACSISLTPTAATQVSITAFACVNNSITAIAGSPSTPGNITAPVTGGPTVITGSAELNSTTPQVTSMSTTSGCGNSSANSMLGVQAVFD